MRYKIYQTLFIFALTVNYITGQNSNADLGVAAIGLVVSDIDKSTAFYTDIVGMVPAGSFSLSEEWSKDAGAANNKPFSVKMFKMVDKNSATVLKLAYFESTKKAPLKTGVDQISGVNYLTFYYNNLDDVVTRIKAAGIEIVGWVKEINYQLVFIRDPDGVFVELVGPPE